MDKEKIILEQYKIYTESKDKFIDRSFTTNRFYFVTIIIIGVLLAVFKKISPSNATDVSLFLSFAGLGTAILWYINQDTYSFLIKIKYSNVLEEIEKELPISPNHMEYVASKNHKEQKKSVTFNDIQKFVALVMLIIFTLYFLLDGFPIVINLLRTIFGIEF